MGSRGVQENTALATAKTPARRRRLLLLAFVASLLVLYVGRNWILVKAARFLDISEPAEATEYVMVLGGEMQTRPFVAAAFINAGLAQNLSVFTEASPSVRVRRDRYAAGRPGNAKRARSAP